MSACGGGSARRGAPEKGAYRVLSRVAFGEPIALPAPFDLVIDTAGFPGPDHPSTAATATRTGTESAVETRMVSRARRSPTP